MKRSPWIIIGFICYFILVFLFLAGLFCIAMFIKEEHDIKNDPTLYNRCKIIEEKQITAEDGMTFYTLQVETENPKTPYRLYVFPTRTKENRLFGVKSYGCKIEANVSLIMSSKDESYYVIENFIVNHKSGEYSTIAAAYLKNFETSEENFSEYVPVVKKLVEQGSWFWLHEGAEFLLKSEEKAYIMEILRNFESANKEKTEYSEPCYRSTLTYEKMVNKCNELLQKYGGEQ